MSKITPLCESLARKQGKSLVTVPLLKPNQHAEVLYRMGGENVPGAIDLYVFNDGKLLGGKGYQFKDKAKFSAAVVDIFFRLQEFGLSARKVADIFRKNFLSNVN